MQRIKRIIQIQCKDCFGKGYGHNPDGTRKPCEVCGGTGEVERVVNEILTDENGIVSF
jgi:DnaJ-class molecular chaperone